MHRVIGAVGIIMTAGSVMVFGVRIEAESAAFSFPGSVPVARRPQAAPVSLSPGACIERKNLMSIHYSVPEAASVRIYSIDGSLVARLGVSQGKGTVMWDISAQAAGMYFVSLDTGSNEVKHKIPLYR